MYGIYANIKDILIDGIHGTPYIAAPLGSVMGIYIYIHKVLLVPPDIRILMEKKNY